MGQYVGQYVEQTNCSVEVICKPAAAAQMFARMTGVTLLVMALCCVAGPLHAQSDGSAPREWVSPLPGNAQRGNALYEERCTACHAVDSNKIGPAHRGVLGRRVGSLRGYKYSEELGRSRLRWTPQTLNAWLEDPENLIPGQRMGSQVDIAQDRADLIVYLASLR